MNPSARRIWAMAYRHFCLYRGSWPRVLELMYWPVLQMVIWAFVTQYAGAFQGAASIAAGALIGAVLLWETATRSQLGFTIAFLEEIWSRNLGNLFVSPIRPWELLVSLALMSLARVGVGIGAASVLAAVLYAFDITDLGLSLIPFMASLMVFGWAIALGRCRCCRFGCRAWRCRCPPRMCSKACARCWRAGASRPRTWPGRWP
jgi:ABC-2 type transport system permease protein